MACFLSLLNVSQKAFFIKNDYCTISLHLVSRNPVNGQQLVNNHGQTQDKKPPFPSAVHQNAPALTFPRSSLISRGDGFSCDLMRKLRRLFFHKCASNVPNNDGLCSRSDGRLKSQERERERDISQSINKDKHIGISTQRPYKSSARRNSSSRILKIASHISAGTAGA